MHKYHLPSKENYQLSSICLAIKPLSFVHKKSKLKKKKTINTTIV